MTMKVNLDSVEVFTDPSHRTCTVINARQQVATAIYNLCHGLPALALSTKMYNATGTLELDDKEMEIIREVMKYFNPAMIEALQRILGDGNQDTGSPGQHQQ